jgi:hypothetical protein
MNLKVRILVDMVAYAYNPGTWMAKAGGLRVQG